MNLPPIRKSLIHKIVVYSDKGYSFQQISILTQIPEEEIRWVAFRYQFSLRELHMREIATNFQYVENFCNKMLSDPKLSDKYKKEYLQILKNVGQYRKDFGIGSFHFLH